MPKLLETDKEIVCEVGRGDKHYLRKFADCKASLNIYLEIKTCLWCSHIEINSSAETIFQIHFRIFKRFSQWYLIISHNIRCAFQIVFKYIKQQNPLKSTPWPDTHP